MPPRPHLMRMGRERIYAWKPFIGSNERPLDTDDLTRSVVIARRTEAAMLILCCLWTLPWLWF